MSPSPLLARLIELDDTNRYAHYIATKEARRHQLMGLVAEDWAQRRGDYWPTTDGVGQSHQAVMEAMQR